MYSSRSPKNSYTFPTGKLTLDESFEGTESLVGLWLPGVSGWDYTGHNHGADIGTSIQRGESDRGPYARIVDDATSDRISLGSISSTNPLSCSKNNELSIMAVAFIEYDYLEAGQGSANPRIIDKSNAGAGGAGYELDAGTINVRNPSGGGMVFFINGQGTSSNDLILADQQTGVLGLTHRSGHTRFFANSKFSNENTAITTAIPTTTTNAALLNWNHSTDRQYRRPVNLIAVWARAISDERMLEYQTNPFRFFKKQKTYSFLSGGLTTTHEAIFSLAASQGLAQSANAALLTSATLAHSLSATANAVSAILSSVSLSSSFSALTDSSAILESVISLTFTNGDVLSATVTNLSTIEAIMSLAVSQGVAVDTQIDFAPTLTLAINNNLSDVAIADLNGAITLAVDTALSTAAGKDLAAILALALSHSAAISADISIEGTVALGVNPGLVHTSIGIINADTALGLQLVYEAATQAVIDAGMVLNATVSISTSGVNPAVVITIKDGRQILLTATTRVLLLSKSIRNILLN